MRAAVYAALVIACLAGAGWFPTRPVAGQEIKQHIYRPGLRNNSTGRRLSEEELNLTLAQLRRKTGFTRLRKRSCATSHGIRGRWEIYASAK